MRVTVTDEIAADTRRSVAQTDPEVPIRQLPAEILASAEPWVLDQFESGARRP